MVAPLQATRAAILAVSLTPAALRYGLDVERAQTAAKGGSRV